MGYKVETYHFNAIFSFVFPTKKKKYQRKSKQKYAESCCVPLCTCIKSLKYEGLNSCFVVCKFYSTPSFVLFILQGAEEPDLPVTSNVSPERNEKNIIPVETVSPSSNVQIPTATVAPPSSTADNTSTLNSLRGVCLIIIFKL